MCFNSALQCRAALQYTWLQVLKGPRGQEDALHVLVSLLMTGENSRAKYDLPSKPVSGDKNTILTQDNVNRKCKQENVKSKTRGAGRFPEFLSFP